MTLTGYHATEAEFPELAELRTFSAAWYRRWRELHLAKYPDADASTRSNLAMFIDMAEQRETVAGPCEHDGCTDAACAGPDGTWCFVAVDERLWSKVDVRTREECWVWTASLDARGYGQYHAPGHQGWPLKAHRVTYEQLRGPIPAGLEIDHLCRNRACVNPWHLEPVTHAENVRRGARARDTCYYGHPLDGFKPSRGTRYCKTCNREGEARRNARKKSL